MRLLKRAGEEAKKNIVLITSEGALLPLAGAVGLHVAKTLQSKPAVPPAPDTKKASTLTITDGTASEDDELDPEAPIGKLAGLDDDDQEETIDVDNTVKDDKPRSKNKDKGSHDKRLKVPNFEKFRLWIILGGIAFVLILVGWIWAAVIAPKALVVLKTDASTVSTTLDLTASPSAKSFDESKSIVRASSKQAQKSDTQKVAATGQKNNGTKATGTVTMSTQTDCVTPVGSVPGGVLVTASSLVFVTQEAASFSPSGFQNGKCVFTSGAIPVVAQNAGDQYNLSARSYTLGGGYSSVSASGSNMSGGTNKIIKVISQQDFDAAKQQILDRNGEAVAKDLKKQLSDTKLVVLPDTLALGEQSITAAPNIGDEAEETTITAKLTYSMLGMNQDDVKQLIEADVKKKIDSSTQQILEEDAGISTATIKGQDKKPNGDVPVNMQLTVSAGAKQDADAIKKEIMGKKKGVAKDTLSKRPGVKEVDIQYSPFWVFSTPKKASKITVVFEKANGNQ
jgi:hypothetical protein